MMRRIRLKHLLLLALALPALFLLLAVAIIPTLAYLTAERVHPDAASVPVQQSAPVEPHWQFAAGASAQQARSLVAEQNLPSLSVAVGVDGQLAWAGAFGWADVESRRPATLQTRYRIGAVSQPLTALAVGLLVDRGALDLDAPVGRYLPDLPPSLAAITLRQAMSHTAGIRHPHIESSCRGHTGERGGLGLALFADDDLQAEPGTTFAFSSYGWILVSAVVEAVSGQPFARYMDDAVLMPAGMTDTAPDDRREDARGYVENLPVAGPGAIDAAVLYHPRASADTDTGLEFPDFTDYLCYGGAGAYLSTPADLVRLAHSMDSHDMVSAHPGSADPDSTDPDSADPHARDSKTTGTDVEQSDGRTARAQGSADAPTATRNSLRPSTLAALHREAILPNGESTGYALGWFVRDESFGPGATRLLGHSGYTIGGTTVLQRFPEYGLVVAVSANVTFAELAPFAADVAALFAAAREASRTATVASRADD